jgi:hypothetical protein
MLVLPWCAPGRRRSSLGWQVAAFALASLVAVPTSADIVIRGARIAEGDLWVLGQVDEPNATITLDDSYFERTDSRGRFEFRLGYHPAACTVILKTPRQSRAVVVANCGQRGPAGPEGAAGTSAPVAAPGAPPLVAAAPASAALAARPTPPPAMPAPPQESAPPVVSCGAKAALYEAANGFRVWVTQKGTLRRAAAPQAQAAQQEVVLHVSIGGQPASLRGPSYAAMMRGGPPREIEEAARQLINWERLTDALPQAIEVVPDTGGAVLARLTFKECGTAPRPPRPAPPEGPEATPRSGSPTASDPDRTGPPPRRLPQGALPDVPP